MHERLVPDNPDFDSIQEASQKSFSFRFEEEDMAAFAGLSGDFNPLHMDDEFARSQGFSGRVVYGGLLTTQISRMIGMHLPGRMAVWSTLDVRFVSPLYIGEEAQITAEIITKSAATTTLVLTIKIERAGDVIARGKAMVQYRNGKPSQA